MNPTYFKKRGVHLVQRFKEVSLITKIGLGIVLGVLLGLFLPKFSFIAVLGTLFVGALKAIAPILVFVLIVASLSKNQEGQKTYVKPIIGLYLFSTLSAAVVAVAMSFLFPVTVSLKGTSAIEQTPPAGMTEILQTVLGNIVDNPVKALLEGNYLGILFWSALIGFALRKSSPKTKEVLEDFSSAITKVVQMVISFAPLGIMGLVFSSIAQTGLEGLTTYIKLLGLLVVTMLVVALVLYPAIVYLYIRENPYPLVWYTLKESGLPAFFTRSSAANIPVNLMLAKKMALDEESFAISLPLGATINMGGAAVTISILTLTAVRTLGMEVNFFLALIFCLLAALSACGASGVAGGSLLLVPLACSLFGISNDVAMEIVGIGFIIGVLQDSIETALNSSADLLFTATVELKDLRKKGEALHLKERLKN